MTKQEAMVKAEGKVVNGEIPFDYANSAKGCVGKKYQAPNGIMTITDWVGQNYVIEINAQYTILPVMYFLLKVKPNIKEA